MIEVDSERRKEYEAQLDDAVKCIERLRIVKEIPQRFFGKEDAQIKAAEILSALVNFIGEQIAHFAILKCRTKVEQGIGYPPFE